MATAFDRCSFVHCFAGAALGWAFAVAVNGWWSILINFGIAAAWEAIELTYYYQKVWNEKIPDMLRVVLDGGEKFRGDTWLQIASDLFFHTLTSVAVTAAYVLDGEVAGAIVAGVLMGTSFALYAVAALCGWCPVRNGGTGLCGVRWDGDWQ